MSQHIADPRTFGSLLCELENLGVNLHFDYERERLSWTAPVGVVTPRIIALLKRFKPTFRQMLVTEYMPLPEYPGGRV